MHQSLGYVALNFYRVNTLSNQYAEREHHQSPFSTHSCPPQG